jgi:hypothetical protein
MTFVEYDSSILRTLLYYEIFDHPLTGDELFYLLPRNSLTPSSFRDMLHSLSRSGAIRHQDGFYSLTRNGTDLGAVRLRRQRLARRRIRIARLMAHVIKRFPFVRAIFISGDLSKGVAEPASDIDYVVVTVPGRLWICRMFLVMFKKIFLLNSKKYFCLNYYIDTEHLECDDRNYYTATEIAHLKPVFSTPLFLKYMNANSWIRRYFPNYRVFALQAIAADDRRSILQRLFEFPFRGRWADRLNARLMEVMKRVWQSRYPEYDAVTRERVFRCDISESRAYVGNFSVKILELYRRKLKAHSLEPDHASEEPAA